MKKLLSLFLFAFLCSVFLANAQTPDANGIVYVKPTATGTANGNSWINATADLQGAINVTGVSKVFVAVGNYNVGSNSFIMKNGVEIYGGFNPVGNTTDWNTRTLPQKGMGDGSVLNGQSTRNVIWNVFTAANPMDNTAVLDGFTIMNGKGSTDYGGAGIRNIYASPTLRNLMVKNNSIPISLIGAVSYGGGIYNENSSPIITNAVLKGNGADYGSGVANKNSSSVFINVSISGNTRSGSSDIFYGAGMNNEAANVTLINVTIAHNKLRGAEGMQGAGIRNDNSTLTAYNTIIWGNQKLIAGGFFGDDNIPEGADIENIGTSTVVLKNSITQSYAAGTPADNNLVGVDPYLVDGANGDYTLAFGSPAINTGDNTFYTGLSVNTQDLAGNARVYTD